MKRLIVCCDGTWNTPDQEQDGVPIPTNVVRIYNAIKSVGDDGTEQRKYYHPGVGSEGNWWEKLAGGSGGVGLDQNIQSAYKWLGENFETGDHIFLFGFSRGAYTVRSLAGMISACGLLRLAELKEKTAWHRVETAFTDCYRIPIKKRTTNWSKNWAVHSGDDEDEEVGVFFLGVWDTVGALGIPDNLALLNLFDPDRKHNFHDTRLTKKVVHAYHAIALDEWRASFTPTLWADVKNREKVHQVWFPGCHSDVGGGYLETGLSDGALKWMIDSVSRDEIGLEFRGDMVEQIKPNYQDVLHDSLKGFFSILDTHPRPIPLLQSEEERTDLHESVTNRLVHPPIAQGSYHPTELLKNNVAIKRSIYAREPWNETGVFLQEGVEYEFEAEGEWLDRKIKCGPGGTSDRKFQLAEIAHLAGSLWGKIEGAFKWVSKNESADFKGSKRIENAPWFCLMGVIANSGNPDEDGTPAPAETIKIGKGCKYIPNKPGYLYCFANDAWNFYDNNRGCVSLKIVKT